MARNASRSGGMPFAQQKRDPCIHYLLEVVSSVLEELVRAGEEEKVKLGGTQQNLQIAKFNGLHPPSISITYYLQRIAQFSGCSNECFVLMLIYIDRLVTNKNIVLDAYNVHRLIISAILLSAKFFDDHFYFNPHFAGVGGLPEHEMNALELEFLFLIEFNLYVAAEDYQTYYNTLTRMARSRFINQTLPPIPSIPHIESNLPQALPQPPEKVPLPEIEFKPVPLPKINLKNRNKSKGRSSSKSSKERTDSENGSAKSGNSVDQQWVHVSTADATSRTSHSSTYSDFTIVNRSPDNFEYQQNYGVFDSHYQFISPNERLAINIPRTDGINGISADNNSRMNGYVHPSFPPVSGIGALVNHPYPMQGLMPNISGMYTSQNVMKRVEETRFGHAGGDQGRIDSAYSHGGVARKPKYSTKE